jgi:hypothetical protein
MLGTFLVPFCAQMLFWSFLWVGYVCAHTVNIHERVHIMPVIYLLSRFTILMIVYPVLRTH